MNLDITFGWHLDGPSYPEVAAVGKLVLGPIGFTNQLALRLGMLTPFPAPAVRIAEYMSRLAQLDDGRQFYSHSFYTDSWGTAKALLFLRDELVAAGWKAEVHDDASTRIRTLARIESLAETDRQRRDLFCLSDLLSVIAEKLESGGNRLPIRSIKLLDERSSLPPIWQRILRALESNNVTVEDPKTTSLDSNSDLERTTKFLFENLIEGNERESKSGLNGDGTLIVLESDDEVQAADYLTEFLKSQTKHISRNGNASDESGTIAIVRGSSTSFLDHLLKKNGLPILGGSASSPQRGFMMLLPMAIELCWEPFDPARLIEFLMLPHCPVPKTASSPLIAALKSEPGTGGRAWKTATMRSFESQKNFEKKRRTDLENIDLDGIIFDAQTSWKKWIEPDRFDPTEGMPKETIVAICKRVQLHAQKLYNALPPASPFQTNEVFIATASYAETLASAIDLCREERISRSQLHRMIESVMDTGYRADIAEASPWTCVDHPGQIYDAVDTVVWWGFVSDKRHMRTSPWTSEELIFLSKQGIELEHPQAAIIREAKSWRRPMNAPANRMLFIAPRTVAGSPTASHPFFHELTELIEASAPAARNKIVQQAHVIYQQPVTELFDARIERDAIPISSLTAARPVWKISKDLISWGVESPSSLERMLACPMSWLMRDRAKLRPGHLLLMSQGEQLAGNLAHAVFASIFSDEDSLTFEGTAQYAAELFDELCPKIAAPLMLPGNSLERQRLRTAIIAGADKLAVLLNEAGFSAVKCETVIEEKLDDITLIGRSDMYLVHPDNQDYVIDLKWTKRSSSYRRRELVEGRAIQLAIYSTIHGRQSGHSTNAGYYMISQGQLLSSSETPFPSHSYVVGPPLTGTFEKVLTNYKKHISHLNAGTVYATGLEQPFDDDDIAGGRAPLIIDDDLDLIPMQVPEITLALEPPCKICDFGRLCGKKGFNS